MTISTPPTTPLDDRHSGDLAALTAAVAGPVLQPGEARLLDTARRYDPTGVFATNVVIG
jgi:hypothetical protein